MTPLLSVTFDLSAYFISNKSIWRQTEAISVPFSLDMACTCVRQCTARGQTAFAYLEPLYDKSLMEQLLVLTHITVNKVHHNKSSCVVFCAAKGLMQLELLHLQCLSKIERKHTSQSDVKLF